VTTTEGTASTGGSGGGPSAALATMAGFVLEDGRSWGSAATEAQIAQAAAVLDPTGTVRRFWLGRARGYSKTTDVAAMSLAALITGIIPAGGQGFVCAADEDQARLLLEAAEGFIRRGLGLNGLVRVERRRIVGPAENEVRVLASDAPSAYGLKAHWWVLDELAQWADTDSAQAFYAAISTAWHKVPGCRVVVITTAGSPDHWSYAAYTRAAASKLWAVFDLAGPPPWSDPAEIEDQRQGLPESLFRRLILNEWAEPEDRLVRLEDLEACTTHPDQPLPYQAAAAPYLITLDIGLLRDRTALVISHRDPGTAGRPVVIDLIRTWQGTPANPVSIEEVRRHLTELSATYGAAQALVDPHEAASIIEHLTAHRIRVSQYKFSQLSNNELARALYQVIRDQAIRLPDRSDLRDELLHLQLEEVQPGVWRMDHTAGRHDDMAIAIAMATWWHHNHNSQPYPPIAFPGGATRESPLNEIRHPDEWL